MPPVFLAAAIQLNATADRARNRTQADDLIRQAVDAGARFVALPENADQIAPRDQRIAEAETLDGPLVVHYRQVARDSRIWLLLGSFAEKIAGAQKIRNTSVLIDPAGLVVGVYRKIHLFDADPPDGVPYRESATVDAGTEAVEVQTPLGTIGLSICYDLRFPELYRLLSSRGATLLTVPSAFTVPTGHAHWEVLIRARAIENLAYVIAPAQVGDHGNGRHSHGHALIVDPWGTVLADAGRDAPGIALGEVNPAEVDRVRRMLPALDHRRL